MDSLLDVSTKHRRETPFYRVTWRLDGVSRRLASRLESSAAAFAPLHPSSRLALSISRSSPCVSRFPRLLRGFELRSGILVNTSGKPSHSEREISDPGIVN